MIRFTETDKWKDSWFRKLKPSEKLLWFYILDNCDNAGFFEFDQDLCCFMTGMTEQQVEGAIKGLSRGLVGAKDEPLFFVNNFLKHQRNEPLNPDNNAHKQIIKLITDNQPKFSKKLGANKGLKSPIGNVKVKYSNEFESAWAAYGSKGNKKQAFNYWKKLSQLDQQAIEAKIPEYLSANPDEQFRKDFQGWINPANRIWENKLIDSTPSKPAVEITSDDVVKGYKW